MSKPVEARDVEEAPIARFQAPVGGTPRVVDGVELSGPEAILYDKAPDKVRYLASVVKVRERQARQAEELAAAGSKELEADGKGELKIAGQVRPLVITDGHRKELERAEKNGVDPAKVIRAIARRFNTTVDKVHEALIADAASE